MWIGIQLTILINRKPNCHHISVSPALVEQCADVQESLSFCGDSLFSLLDLHMVGSECLECKTGYPVKFMPLTQDRPNSHVSVKIAAATLLHTCFHLHSISLFSLSAHCQYDPIGSISHSLCLQHGLGRQLAQPRTYQFTDGGRHRRPGPWQPEQTSNHGGVLLKHPEPSHHLSWDHPLVEPLHLGRLSVHFGVLFLFVCLSFHFFSCGQEALV